MLIFFLLGAFFFKSSISIKLASFNVQVFGVTKMSKPPVVATLVEIFRRYDLVFFQEIRDSSETAIYEFLDALNDGLSSSEKFNLTISGRLGPTTSKEQYAYFFRMNKLKLLRSYQFDDNVITFDRPPFGAFFLDTQNDFKFFVFGLHDKPTNANEEIKHFADAYESMTKDTSTFSSSEITILKDFSILMGDLNAGCTYFSEEEENLMILEYEDVDLVWLIDRNMDTMVKTDCPYDRFICSSPFQEDLHDIGVLNTIDTLGISYELAVNVSDHFPIQLEFNEDYNDDTNRKGFYFALFLELSFSFFFILICCCCFLLLSITIVFSITVCLIGKKEDGFWTNEELENTGRRKRRSRNSGALDTEHYKERVRHLTQKLLGEFDIGERKTQEGRESLLKNAHHINNNDNNF